MIEAGVDAPAFFLYNRICRVGTMEKKSLQQLIIKLKDLVEELECEVMSDPAAYMRQENFDDPSNYYDYSDNDDDGYCD